MVPCNILLIWSPVIVPGFDRFSDLHAADDNMIGSQIHSYLLPGFDSVFASLYRARTGTTWNMGRRAHAAPAAASIRAASSALMGHRARTGSLSTASTARGGGEATSPLNMVAAEPVLKSARCVRSS